MALVLAPEPPLNDWLSALDAQMQRSPNSSTPAPSSSISAHPPRTTGRGAIPAVLEQRGIRIIGTEGAHPSWDGHRSLGPAAAGFDQARDGRSSRQGQTAGKTAPAAATSRVAALTANTLLIDHPVRSGQSVVFERGDITVLGSVASGAEVMAGGSVHVYGTLRGRAIAGLSGHPGARIFCSKLQAELLAIDGVYQTADDMPAKVLGKPVQAWLDGEQMKISVLD